MLPYSGQWLKRLRPALFRQDLLALFELLRERKIKPLVWQRLPLGKIRPGAARQGRRQREDRADLQLTTTE